MKIVIVTAYYNRRVQFFHTLESIVRSKQDDYTVIAVDDGSDEIERIEDLQNEFDFLAILRIDKSEKRGINSCMAFNLGIAWVLNGYQEGAINPDVVMLQNPECFHVGDVLDYVAKNVTNKNYLTFGTYAIPKDYNPLIANQYNGEINSWIQGLPQQTWNKGIGWYNHEKYRPVYYHFCSAMTFKNMKLLGGFDERFKDGVTYDDNEFVDRITRLGLNKEIVSYPYVIHQGHDRNPMFSFSANREAHKRNKILFEQTKGESLIKVENSYVTI